MTAISRIDPSGLYRLKSIVRTKDGPPPLIDVSRSTWLAGVKSGRFPPPVHMGERMTFWRGSDLLSFVAGVSHEQAA